MAQVQEWRDLRIQTAWHDFPFAQVERMSPYGNLFIIASYQVFQDHPGVSCLRYLELVGEGCNSGYSSVLTKQMLSGFSEESFSAAINKFVLEQEFVNSPIQDIMSFKIERPIDGEHVQTCKSIFTNRPDNSDVLIVMMMLPKSVYFMSRILLNPIEQPIEQPQPLQPTDELLSRIDQLERTVLNLHQVVMQQNDTILKLANKLENVGFPE